nr:helix-turn-helix transcriptional regulator [Streptomyces albus]
MFGVRLRTLRKQRGWSQKELAERVYVTQSRIAQLERGYGARPSAELTHALETVLEADGQLAELWPYVYDGSPRWSRRFFDLAAKAVAIREYVSHTVPGLLQTEAYARAVLGVGLEHPDLLHERVSLRLARQARLEKPDAPKLCLILDQAVLLHTVGGEDAMREQLLALRAACDRHSLRVLPFGSREHAMLGGSVVILTMSDGTEVVYSEGADHGRLLEDPALVAAYTGAFEQLHARSYGEARSARLITEAAARFTRTRSRRRAVTRTQSRQRAGRHVRRRPGA